MVVPFNILDYCPSHRNVHTNSAIEMKKKSIEQVQTWNFTGVLYIIYKNPNSEFQDSAPSGPRVIDI